MDSAKLLRVINKYRILELVFLVGALALAIYRIFILSFTHDEALSLFLYVNKNIPDLLFNYGHDQFIANNHFLNTLLMKLGQSLGGGQEAWLRLGAWLASLLYFSAVYFLTSAQNKASQRWLIIIGLVAQPFLFDYLSLARGYGLALALLLWSIFFLRDYLDCHSLVSLTLASVSGFLAIWANVAFLYPIVALWLISFGYQLVRKRITVVDLLVIVILFILPSSIFIAPYLSFLAANEEVVMFGETSFIGFLSSLSHLFLVGFSRFYGAGLLVTVLLGGMIAYVKKRGSQMFYSLVLWLILILLWLAHSLTGAFYPMDRAAIYFIPLIMLALSESINNITDRYQTVIWIIAVLLAGQLIIFGYYFKINSTITWAYDADTKQIVEELRTRPEKMILVHSWWFQPSLIFYFNQGRVANIKLLDAQAPQAEKVGQLFLLYADDFAWATQHNLHLIKEYNSQARLYGLERQLKSIYK
jgi:hypothetical protein